jgi:hypothetical protein
MSARGESANLGIEEKLPVQHSLVLLCVLERLSTAGPQKQISERQSVLTIPQSNWCTISVRMNT